MLAATAAVKRTAAVCRRSVLNLNTSQSDPARCMLEVAAAPQPANCRRRPRADPLGNLELQGLQLVARSHPAGHREHCGGHKPLQQLVSLCYRPRSSRKSRPVSTLQRCIDVHHDHGATGPGPLLPLPAKVVRESSFTVTASILYNLLA